MDRKFEASWQGSYVKAEKDVVEIDFFDEANRYDAKEIKRIESLAVGQSLTFDKGDHIVTRIE